MIDLSVFQLQNGAGPCSLDYFLFCMILSINIETNLVLDLTVFLMPSWINVGSYGRTLELEDT